MVGKLIKYDFISFMPTSPALVSELVYLKHGLRAVSLRIIKNKIIGDLVSSVIAELDAKVRAMKDKNVVAEVLLEKEKIDSEEFEAIFNEE